MPHFVRKPSHGVENGGGMWISHCPHLLHLPPQQLGGFSHLETMAGQHETYTPPHLSSFNPLVIEGVFFRSVYEGGSVQAARRPLFLSLVVISVFFI